MPAKPKRLLIWQLVSLRPHLYLKHSACFLPLRSGPCAEAAWGPWVSAVGPCPWLCGRLWAPAVRSVPCFPRALPSERRFTFSCSQEDKPAPFQLLVCDA